jgi:tRNA-dihydrouridine synthase B
MAGVTDRPFRQLCKKLGAGHAISEMAASNPQLWKTDKTTRRLNHLGETQPIAVQIAGADPKMMADAAVYNIERGAQIIDINMGCPAKKVCAVAAGSALLQNESLVNNILKAVHAECEQRGVPLTLKYRTGWSPEHNNAIQIAQMAESIGVDLITLHGRTRACGYTGQAEYDTIKAVKQAVKIPVIANGDITSPEKARFVLDYTGADGLMIGRAAQGNPWIFREILHYLNTGEYLDPPTLEEAHAVMMHHLHDHHEFYGEKIGLLTARKHLQWYFGNLVEKSNLLVNQLMLANNTKEQLQIVDHFFLNLKSTAQLYFSSTTHSPQSTQRKLVA